MDFKTPHPPTLLNKPVSVGIVTEDVEPRDPPADDVMQRPRRINAFCWWHEVSISRMTKQRNAQIQHRLSFSRDNIRIFPIRFPLGRVIGNVFPGPVQFLVVSDDVFVIITLQYFRAGGVA